MQIFPKTKGFCNKGGLSRRKKLALLNKNYICILRKNSNPEYWVLEKTRFLEKIETPVVGSSDCLSKCAQKVLDEKKCLISRLIMCQNILKYARVITRKITAFYC